MRPHEPHTHPPRTMKLTPYRASPQLEGFILRSAPAFYLTHRPDLPFSAVRDAWLASRTVPVWDGGSNETIFSTPDANHAMRALHDLCHISLNVGFAYDDEMRVSDMLCSWARAARLSNEDVLALEADNAGQSAYHKLTGDFPANQALFVSCYMYYGGSAPCFPQSVCNAYRTAIAREARS